MRFQAEVRPLKVRPVKVREEEIRRAEIRPTEVRPTEVRLVEFRPAEFRPAKVRVAEARPTEVRTAQVLPSEVRIAKVYLAEVSRAEVRSYRCVVEPPLIPGLDASKENLQMFLVGHDLYSLSQLRENHVIAAGGRSGLSQVRFICSACGRPGAGRLCHENRQSWSKAQ